MYAVYQIVDGEESILIGQTNTTSFLVLLPESGNDLCYQISAVDGNGFQGARSRKLKVVVDHMPSSTLLSVVEEVLVAELTSQSARISWKVNSGVTGLIVSTSYRAHTTELTAHVRVLQSILLFTHSDVSSDYFGCIRKL